MIKLNKILLIASITFSSILYAAPVITWTPPLTRENGDTLSSSEIAMYKMYCGTTSGTVYNDEYPIIGNITEIDITTLNLSNGSHYCVVTTVDTDGRESTYSNEVVININLKSKPRPPTIPQNTALNYIGTL